ncbi:MAG: tryptophan--tRNA ligase [Proteobacteria bacterium]|nr:tryptophan--tRNA ligase [Pseudomonadota bacterium]
MRLLTGIKPTGMPHLGNYVGAIRPALSLLRESHGAHGLFFIADYHALIDQPDSQTLRKNILEVAAAWLSFSELWQEPALSDPHDKATSAPAKSAPAKKATLYLQSDIPEIFELQWIFSCFTPKGVMNRGHAYKARLQDNVTLGKEGDAGVNMGLYSYPVLMAADILIAHTDVVPVGIDQKQHVEIACDLAQRLIHNYGNILIVPEVYIHKEMGYLKGLDGRKMSKSYGNHLPLFCDEKTLRKWVMKIPTDSSPPTAAKKCEGTIMEWYELFASPDDVVALKKRYLEGIGWGEAKEHLFEALRLYFHKPRQKYAQWMNDPARLRQCLDEGAEVVRPIAQATLAHVKKALGLSSHP